MLTRMRLRDFKSFADQQIALSPFTLLVGANASGKSNLLDAVQLLGELARRLSVDDALNGDAFRSGIRGGSKEAARGRRTEFAVEAEWHVHGLEFAYDGTFDLTGVPRIDGETLEGNGIAISRRRTGVSLLSDRADDMAPFEALLVTLPETLLLDLRPEHMRRHVPKVRPAIGATGENLSAAVWQLVQDRYRKADLLHWLSELCSPRIMDIEFDQTTLLDEVMLVLVEADFTKVSARNLSDGTLRFLGTIVALLTIKEGETLLIEEIESGLHPSRVHLLVDLAEEITRGGSRQVIATTHSPHALLALSSEGLRNAVVFGRVEGQEGSIMKRLADLSNFDEVEAREGIDELFTSRWLEHSL